MPIKPKCDRCGSELGEFGGLLFSPPNANNVVKKYHLCRNCYNTIVMQMKKVRRQK